jgi:hypothetical protein
VLKEVVVGYPADDDGIIGTHIRSKYPWVKLVKLHSEAPFKECQPNGKRHGSFVRFSSSFRGGFFAAQKEKKFMLCSLSCANNNSANALPQMLSCANNNSANALPQMLSCANNNSANALPQTLSCANNNSANALPQMMCFLCQ